MTLKSRLKRLEQRAAELDAGRRLRCIIITEYAPEGLTEAELAEWEAEYHRQVAEAGEAVVVSLKWDD